MTSACVKKIRTRSIRDHAAEGQTEIERFGSARARELERGPAPGRIGLLFVDHEYILPTCWLEEVGMIDSEYRFLDGRGRCV